MKLTYYGHSCFSVQFGGKTLLFDPFITPNPLAKNIKIETIEADYILISHGHFDHINDAISVAQSATPNTVLGILEIAGWLERKGVKNTVGMKRERAFA